MSPDYVICLLLFSCLSSTVRAVIDNRTPEANYVIPIDDTQTAEVYCVSYFAKTIIQELRGPGDVQTLTCQACEQTHVRNRCCTTIHYSRVENGESVYLRCTSENSVLEDAKDRKNIPKIDVAVVRLISEVQEDDKVEFKGKKYAPAESSEQYFCHEQSNKTQLTAGSHIGLGWKDQPLSYSASSSTDSPPESSYTEKAKQYDQVIDNNDNARNKEEKFSQLYSHPTFQRLWISEDRRVELMAHNRTFGCNETEYYLERGSACLTPSPRAFFIMTNCSLVEKIFIVIGVIVLLIISYIVFNVLVWLWNYFWHKSKRHDDDDLAVLM